MKTKWLPIGIAVWMLLSTVSCSGDSGETQHLQNESETAVQTETETSPLETLTAMDYDDYEFRIISMDLTW